MQNLQEILGETEDSPAEIRTAIEANKIFETEFRARHVNLSDVVAVTKDEDGSATVYYNMPTQ